MTDKTDDIESPCRAICQLDDNEEYCIGCFRTPDEIASWPHLTPEQKQAIIEKLQLRRDHYENS